MPCAFLIRGLNCIHDFCNPLRMFDPEFGGKSVVVDIVKGWKQNNCRAASLTSCHINLSRVFLEIINHSNY